MDRQLLEYYNLFSGMELEFVDKNGKIQQRVLSHVYFHHESELHMAVFLYRSSEAWKMFLYKTVKVSLNKVRKPSLHNLNNRGIIETHQILNANLEVPDFQMYGNRYFPNGIANFNNGDQIVWTTYTNNNGACVGTLMFTAHSLNPSSKRLSEVAVVSMDGFVATSDHAVAPGYLKILQTLQHLFPYVIPLTEVLKLNEWTFYKSKEKKEQAAKNLPVSKMH